MCVCVCVCVSPPDSAALLVVDLDELAKTAGVVVVGRLGVPKSLMRKWKESPSGQHISIDSR